jgi:hypothetical protein
MIMGPTKGYKTKSFWAMLGATAIAALMGSGAMEGGAVGSTLATLAAALGATGYSSIRAFEKGKDGKKAWKTTEFWLSGAAVIVGALMASGVFSDGSTSAKMAGIAASLLGSMGYAARFKLPPKV